MPTGRSNDQAISGRSFCEKRANDRKTAPCQSGPAPGRAAILSPGRRPGRGWPGSVPRNGWWAISMMFPARSRACFRGACGATREHLQRQDGEYHQHAELRHVARQGGEKMPIEVVANRLSAAPAKNSATEPSTGTPRTPRTMRLRDRNEAISTTRLIDPDLGEHDLRGCNRHHQQVLDGAVFALPISAAPVR